ncbi:MAG: dihydroorotate dehydrogenase [Gemmatimonadota bacterium]|nr:dihydroorotate dehydrogenase [Gemmatimonadota bacterium]MDH5197291.1 dihydroorotate dehydrogenase [Gemmatimonadota bacterium]
MTPGPVEAFGTTFQNPILLAAGTAGFGRELAGTIDLEALGGVVTKSVSPEARAGNPPPRVAEFPGGMLNSVGLANPGLDVVEREELPWLERHLRRARVVVSVVGNTVDDYVTVVARLTDYPVVTAFELNLSCPNTERGGELFGANDAVLADLVERCRSASRRPVIAKLAPTLPDVGRTARVAQAAGVDGFAVVNTMPGMLFREGGADGPSREPRLGAGNGGVSGPPLLPVGVLATRRVREATGLPVIGVGGVRRAEDVEAYLTAGAVLVAIGTAALADPRLPERLARRFAGG